MKGLKWFAGGKERQEQAVAIIDEVIETIGDKPDYADLKQVLHSYRTELADSRSATPYILSRMSLEISKVVRKDQLTLSPVSYTHLIKILGGSCHGNSNN